MPGSSSPSFIPKQNPVKTKRVAISRQVYVFTIVSYLLIIAALVASAAVFFYDRYSKRALAAEVEALATAVAQFDVNKMNDVVMLEEQLVSVAKLLDENLSMRVILNALETTTIDSVQIRTLSLERISDTEIEVLADMNTDSFDSVLFQRTMYEEAEKLSGVSIEELSVTLDSDDQFSRVLLSVVFAIDPGVLPYEPVPTTSLTDTASGTPSTTPAPTGSGPTTGPDSGAGPVTN